WGISITVQTFIYQMAFAGLRQGEYVSREALLPGPACRIRRFKSLTPEAFCKKAKILCRFERHSFHIRTEVIGLHIGFLVREDYFWRIFIVSRMFHRKRYDPG